MPYPRHEGTSGSGDARNKAVTGLEFIPERGIATLQSMQAVATGKHPWGSLENE